jgi:hypothetical protein
MNGGSRVRGIITAALVLIAATAAVVPLPPSTVERVYSRRVYPAIQGALTPISNLTSVAWLDLAAGVLFLLFAFGVLSRARSAGWRSSASWGALTLLQAGAIVYLLFLATWGLNYRRVPLEKKLDFDRSRVTVQRALELANEAARRANALHGPAHARGQDRLALRAAFESAARTMGGDSRWTPGRPKRSLLGFYFRKAAIDGMTDPVFLEVILNPELLQVEEPEVLMHEWAHLAGYADESEANFLAWLACLRGDPLAQYSGWLSAYQRASSALPPAARVGRAKLDAGPRSDLGAIAARYNRSSRVVRRAASDVYDTYLKANRIPEGIANYDQVIQLMLGTTLGSDWNPR